MTDGGSSGNENSVFAQSLFPTIATSENDVILHPSLTSHDISHAIAMALGGSFHVTSIGRIS